MYKCEKGEKQYKMCKEAGADYCSDCPHGVKEETADEMFEELGYEKPEDTIFNIEKFVKTIGKTKYCIAFDYFYRRISVFTFEDRESRKDISMQELQAINKKCQELGWI